MIINSLSRTNSGEGIIRFDERFTTPVTLNRIALDGTGYLSLFMNRASVADSSDVASVTVTVAQATPGNSNQLAVLGSRQSISELIQTTQSQTFRAASSISANNLLTVKLSVETLRANMGTVYIEYVVPHEISTLLKTKSVFYEDIFLRKTDPGAVGSVRIGTPVDDTAMIVLNQAGVSQIASSTGSEWYLVTISSYNGSGIFVGKDVVRVSKKTLLLEHEITKKRAQLPPALSAQQQINPGVVSLAVRSEATTKLFNIDLNPGSLLQDTGGNSVVYAGQSYANSNTATVIASNHLAQSSENVAIYRAVDSLGRFAGAVVGGMMSTTCVQASLSLSRTDDGVLIELLNVPANVSGVKIYRYSNTIDQEFGEQVGTLLLSQQTTGTPIDVSITDRLDQSISTVARSMYYTYYAVCIDIKGNQTQTRNATILIDPSSVAIGFAKPVVDGLTTQYVQQSNTFNLSFELSFDITQETATSELVKILTAQGLIQYYSSDIDPKQLAQLVTAKTTLRNMVTGEEIFLGVYGQGSTVTYSGLQPSYYKLELITTVRNPQTSVDAYVATGYSTPRPGNSFATPFQYSPAITLNPTALLTGTVVPSSGSNTVPTKTYERYTGNSALVGFFVDATYVPIDLMAASKPVITQKQLTGVFVTPTLEKITWQIDKPNVANSISHFVVWRDGKPRAVIAGSSASNGVYSFYDTPVTAKTNGTYGVVGWLLDGTVLAGSDTITTT